MAIPKKILEFLKKNKIKYETIKHRTVYTAFDKAATLKIKPAIVGKTLIMRTRGNLAMVLIPAHKNLDKNKFKKIIKAKKINFASEKLIKNKFKGVKLGAVPPFGVLWRMPTFVDKKIFQNPKIIINSGEYNQSIKLDPKFFKKLIPDIIIGDLTKTKK